jgi:catechol 2,3-dioxygenase-like lactoylglutathione lyase family enzyme
VTIHHIELWVPDLDRAERSWEWLLGCLGYEPFRSWERGRSWRNGATYIVVEHSPDMVPDMLYSRLRPGMNHVAFHADSEAAVDAIVADAPDHGWTPMFADRFPHASGPQTYAGYLENGDGFEVEIVAPSDASRSVSG